MESRYLVLLMLHARRQCILGQDNVPVGVHIGGVNGAGVGCTGSDAVRKGLLHGTADGAAQLPRTIGRHLVPGQHLGCGGRVVQRVALPGCALLKLDKQPVCDPGQLLRAERVKEDGLIQAPHQLGAEKLLSLLDGLLAAAPGLGSGGPKAQRRRLPGQTPRTQIRGKQSCK